MKTHPDLLVRDALAERFVQACRGTEEARRDLADLARWAGGGAPSEALSQACVEDGTPLFTERGLNERFHELEPYTRDRARRFEAALSWIEASDCFEDALECARAAWDAGLFFEVHEILEPAWVKEEGPRRTLLQGVIMAGAALHHLTNGNRAGARGLLRDAARKLVDPGAQDLDYERFARELDALGARIESGEVRGVEDLDDFPRLESAGRADPD